MSAIGFFGVCRNCGMALSPPASAAHQCAWGAVPSRVPTFPQVQPYGWICPRCGRSNAPSVLICSCQPAAPAAGEKGEKEEK
jgi:hypothetical protein